MEFNATEDITQLADGLARLLKDRCSFEQRRARVAAGQPHDPGTWAAFADMGLTALPLPEAHGGFDGGARGLLPVMQALGTSLSLEPFLATVVLAATALRTGGDAQLQSRVLPQVATGQALLAWAHDEAAGRHAPRWVETRAERRDGRWTVSGAKSPVLAAGLAGQYVVSARVGGGASDADGLALFLVDAGAPGCELRAFTLVDDTPAGELRFSQAPATPLGDPFDSTAALRAIEATLNAGIAAACAEMVGAAQAAFDITTDYLRTRKQFGRTIGENQALRHRAAEMLVGLEMARSMAIAAAVAADDPQAEDARADLHRAKLSVARNARAVAHAAIQLHGGIGMTEEYPVGHALRRIHVLDQLFGDADAHAARLAALS